MQCVVTSPPYWGLRDYGVPGQIGLEPTPEQYLETMVGVFREVRRVLRGDGTVWLNMGDTYNSRLNGSHGGWNGSSPEPQRTKNDGAQVDISAPGFKPKDLLGMPWRVAFALQADGWYLRADIIWAKPNPMPESVTDRPTKAHEYVFLLAKSARYYYDGEAIREPHTGPPVEHYGTVRSLESRPLPANVRGSIVTAKPREYNPAGRNARTVWTIASEPYPEAHFATFPAELARRCILAGSSARGACATCGAPWARQTDTAYMKSPVHGAGSVIGRHYATGANGWDGAGLPRLNKQITTTGWAPSCAHDTLAVPCTVLDPFAGSGTVGEVAERNGRDAVLIELSETYGALIRERTAQRGLFAQENGHAVSLEQ